MGISWRDKSENDHSAFGPVLTGIGPFLIGPVSPPFWHITPLVSSGPRKKNKRGKHPYTLCLTWVLGPLFAPNCWTQTETWRWHKNRAVCPLLLHHCTLNVCWLILCSRFDWNCSNLISALESCTCPRDPRRQRGRQWSRRCRRRGIDSIRYAAAGKWTQANDNLQLLTEQADWIFTKREGHLNVLVSHNHLNVQVEWYHRRPCQSSDTCCLINIYTELLIFRYMLIHRYPLCLINIILMKLSCDYL